MSGANQPVKSEIAITGEVNTDRARRLMANVFQGSASKQSTGDENATEGKPDALADVDP